MTPVFLDTSGLIAVANRKDHCHGRAEAAWKQLLHEHRRLVTTNIVIIELGDGLSRLRERPIAIAIRDMLIRTATIIHMTSSVEDAAWALFTDRGDKEWGMTDCVSMVVMQQHGITDVFTFDDHFHQAGFRVVPWARNTRYGIVRTKREGGGTCRPCGEN